MAAQGEQGVQRLSNDGKDQAQHKGTIAHRHNVSAEVLTNSSSAMVQVNFLQYDNSRALQPLCSWYLGCYELTGRWWRSTPLPSQHRQCADFLFNGCVLLAFKCLGTLHWYQRSTDFRNVSSRYKTLSSRETYDTNLA